jgi:uncharacterized protein
MDVTPLIPKGRHVITHYGQGAFAINQKPVKGSIILGPLLLEPWNVAGLVDLAALLPLEAFLQPAAKPEIMLLGIGSAHRPLPRDIALWANRLGIAIEWMVTGAACRTYNVLLAEERRVLAALKAV